MDSAVAAWAGVGVLSAVSIGGWVVTWIRNGKNQARLFGKLEGKVDGLSTRLTNVEQGFANINSRIDNLISRGS